MLGQYYRPTDHGKTLYVDGTHGSDSSGRANSEQYPFQTLPAARAAAVSGDLVYVRPGTYAITAALGKGGVDWWFDAGAVVDFNESGTASVSAIWDSAGSYNVTGFGIFNRSVSSQTAGPRSCVVDHSGSVNLVIEGLDFFNSGTGAGGAGELPVGINRAPTGGAGFLFMRARYINGSTGIRWKRGYAYITARSIGGGGYGVEIEGTQTPSGDLYITADEIEGGEAAIYDASTNADTAAWITTAIVNITSSTGASVYANGAGRVYVRAQKLFGRIQADGTGMLYVDADKISPEDNSLNLYSGAGTSICKIKIEDWDASTLTTGAFSITGGTLHEIVGGRLRCGASAGGFAISDGAALLREFIIDTSANSATSPVTKTGGTLTLKDCVLKAEGSADSVAGNGTVNVWGHLSSNRNENGSIALSSDMPIIFP